jgi:hypothetical protein
LYHPTRVLLHLPMLHNPMLPLRIVTRSLLVVPLATGTNVKRRQLHMRPARPTIRQQ